MEIVENQLTAYNFRKRSRIQDTVYPPSKKSRGTVACPNTYIRMSKLIPAPKNILVEGLVVIAKMTSYSAWPSRILSFRKSCVNVHFFGDDTTGTVKYENIGLFGDNSELIKQNVKKNLKNYYKAVRCAEGALNVPRELSILNF